MIVRLLPHPVLSVVIAALWVALVNEVAIAHALFGAALGIVIPFITQVYWPDGPVIRRPLKIVEFIAIVVWDILVSNLQVARLILFRRSETLRSCFVAIPLDLRTPEAIAVLAGTITMTPGTISTDVASDRSALLVHCLDAEDARAVATQIKHRYERRLKEIFE